MGENLLVSLSVSGSEVPRSDVEVDYSPPQFCIIKLNNSALSSAIDIITDEEEKCVQEYPIVSSAQENQKISTEGAVVSIQGFNFGTSEFDVDLIVSIPGIGDGQILLHDHELFKFGFPQVLVGTGKLKSGFQNFNHGLISLTSHQPLRK